MENKTNIFRPAYRELNEAEKVAIDNIKTKATELYELISNECTPERNEANRYYALSKTALEESIMWAVKGKTL